MTERDRERDRERQRATERQRETERDRERQRETERDRERQIQREREKERGRERQRPRERQGESCEMSGPRKSGHVVLGAILFPIIQLHSQQNDFECKKHAEKLFLIPRSPVNIHRNNAWERFAYQINRR